MSRARFMASFTVWIFLMLTLILGCGKKGDPAFSAARSAPPLFEIGISKTSEAVVIHWPVRSGQEKPAVFRIERSALDARAGGCPGCPREFDVIADISAEDPACKDGKKQQCRYIDYNVIEQYHYIYRLLSCDEKGICEKISAQAEIKY